MAKKKIFPNGFLNSGLFSLGKGLVMNATGIGTLGTVKDIALGAVKGAVNKVANKKADNLAAKTGGKGKVDYYEYIGIAFGVIVLLYTTYLLLTGQIGLGEYIDANQGALN
jgi:hypothetical protein